MLNFKANDALKAGIFIAMNIEGDIGFFGIIYEYHWNIGIRVFDPIDVGCEINHKDFGLQLYH